MTGLLWLLAWPAIAIPGGFLIGRLLRNLEQQVPARPPGPASTPVPGQPPFAEDAAPPPAATAPAPVTHGPIDYRLTVWECGRIRMWDGHGRAVGGRDCIRHVDWDAELRAEVDRETP